MTAPKAHRMAKLPKAKREKHSRVAYAVCRRCGIVALKNRATETALGKPCQGLDDAP